MKKNICLSLLISLFIFVGAAGAAQVGVTDDPLVVGGGARPLGMGRAFAALAGDADAVFVNPAGAASLKEPQAMAMFANLLGGAVYYSEYCGALPAEFGSISLGFIDTGVKDITTIVNSQEVLTDYYDSVLALNYASPLSRFFQYGENVLVGLNFKIFSRGFTGGYNQSSSGFSSDFGIKYVMSPYLNFALVRQNFLPVSLGAGINTGGGAQEAVAGMTKLALAVKPVPFDGTLALAGEIDIPSLSGDPTTTHLGVEWKATPNFFVRAGLDDNVDSSAPGGASFNPTIGTSLLYAGFRMDYAYHPYYNDPALAASYISFSYSGDPWLSLGGRTD
jgi:hypothetical protein